MSLNIILVSGVTSTPPMGLFSIAHQLDTAGHRVRIVHTAIERVMDPAFDLGRYVVNNSVDLVGIALHWAHQSADGVRLAESVKASAPSAFVVAGGLTASAFAGEIVDTIPCIDAVIRGEGEQPMCLLADEIAAAKQERRSFNLEPIPNLVWRDASANVGIGFTAPVERPGYRKPILEVIADTGSGNPLPRGVRANAMGWVGSGDRLAMMKYARPDLLEHREEVMSWRMLGTAAPAPVFFLGASRGCPVECVFCGGGRASHAALGGRKKAEFRPVEAVLEDLRSAVEAGFRSFYVSHDPIPNGRFYFDLFERMRAEGLGKKLVMGFGSWGLPNAAFLHAAKETFPHVLVEISPETSNQELRDKVRGFSFKTADLEETLRVADELGIRCEVYFTHPLPGDTAASMRATRAYAHRLARRYSDNINMDLVSLSTDPQSPLAVSPEQFGVTVSARTFADFASALRNNRKVYPTTGRKPWLQNHLEHAPLGMSERVIDMSGVAACTDQALWLRRPLLLHSTCDALGGPDEFELFLERALDPLLTELLAERDTTGQLNISEPEVGRRGIRFLCRAIEKELGDALPGLADIAREAAAREELLSRRFLAVETQYPHSWLNWARPAHRRPALAAASPTLRVRPMVKIRFVQAPPYAADPRTGGSALKAAFEDPDNPRDVTVLLSVGDNPQEEWLLEATPAVDRAIELADGTLRLDALQSKLAAEGFETAPQTVADLIECAMIG